MQVLFTVYRQEINITENTEPRKISKDKKKENKKKKQKNKNIQLIKNFCCRGVFKANQTSMIFADMISEHS